MASHPARPAIACIYTHSHNKLDTQHMHQPPPSPLSQRPQVMSASAQASLLRPAARMDRWEDRKRVREGEQEMLTMAMRKRGRLQQAEDTVEVACKENAVAMAALTLADGRGGREGAWQRPAGIFNLPWQKCRGGLGVGAAGAVGSELRDVFFCSLVDDGVATIGVPGDRLTSPYSKWSLFDEVDAWLATAGDDEVDPLWRSVLEGPKPAASM